MLLNIGCISVEKTLEHDSTVSYTEINGYKFHTKVVGNESLPTIIILHGGPGGDFNYLLSLQELSKTHKVVFYDQRGSGLSPRVTKDQLLFDQYIKDLDGFVNHFGEGEKVILIGHSWGAMLGISYINKYPKKVSNLIAIEPGMLNKKAAIEFVKNMKSSQSVWDMLTIMKHILVYPFITKLDGQEGFDYVMTNMLNRSQPGAPYQCKNEVMKEGSFIRGGYDAFSVTLKPIIDSPEAFDYDITSDLINYQGELLMISSECSTFGFEFQSKYHLELLPKQTKHIKAHKMGHNMITLNPEWSLKVINKSLMKTL